MNKRRTTSIYFIITFVAYVIFFCIPATAPSNLYLVLAASLCATVAFVCMVKVVIIGSKIAKIIAIILALPPLIFLILTFWAAATGGFYPADA